MKSLSPDLYWDLKDYNEDQEHMYYVTGEGTYHQMVN